MEFLRSNVWFAKLSFWAAERILNNAKVRLQKLRPCERLLLAHDRAAASAENRNNGIIDVLIICGQFANSDFIAVGELCRATRREEVLWSALVNLQRGPSGRTVLQFAAQKADVERVRWLLARGANANARDLNGDSALHRACAVGSAKVVALLIAAGADVNVKGLGGESPLCVACHAFASSSEKCALILIQAGASVNAARDDGCTPLMLNCMEIGISALALITAGANVNARNHAGRTALHGTCDAYALRHLLKHGADIDAVDANFNTPLHEACKFNRNGAAMVLLAFGAKLSLVNSDGLTPRDLAKTAPLLMLLDIADALEWA
jgi:ankyrin repeat protein